MKVECRNFLIAGTTVCAAIAMAESTHPHIHLEEPTLPDHLGGRPVIISTSTAISQAFAYTTSTASR